jgi:non-ribosomal peptide synthetase component F
MQIRQCAAGAAAVDDEPTADTLPRLFAAQVRRTPQAPAVVCGNRSLSYVEVDAGADRLARWLVAQGAGPDRVIAVAMSRTPEFAVAVLAVLKAGAAFLSVDLAYPAQRVALLLRDAAPVLVLTDAAGADRLPQGVAHCPVVVADEIHDEVEHLSGAEPAVGEPGRAGHVLDLAYVVYTSGSTGRPKCSSTGARWVWVRAAGSCSSPRPASTRSSRSSARRC